jgi:uncharacterized repeat protein (TIGR01451 family)
MASGAETKLTLVLKGIQGGTWTDVAKVVSAEGATAQDDATTIIELPTLTITKTGPATLNWLEDGSYTITVKNTGVYTATSVVVTDTIPAGMTYHSSIPAGTASGNLVTWNLGTMAPGDTKTITAMLEGTQLGTWTNTVVVVSAEGATDDASVTTIVAALVSFETSLSDSIDPVSVGQQTTYTFTVTNEGPSTVALGVKVNMRISELTQFVSASGPSTYTYSAGTITFAPVATLAHGESLTYTVTVQASATGYVLAKADLTATNYPLIVQTQEGTTIMPS